MGVSDEAMKPMSVPEDIKRAAIEQCSPKIREISRNVISTLELRLKLQEHEGKKNSAETRAAIKKTIMDYLAQLQERGFIDPDPIKVIVTGEGMSCAIELDPNPFLERPHAQD